MRTVLDARARVILVSALVFAAMATAVVSGSSQALDAALMWRVHAASSTTLDALSWWLARVGYGHGVLPFDAVLAIVLFAIGRRQWAAFAFGVLGSSLLLNTLLKWTFARSRPSLWSPSELQLTYSFPSGHAMATGTLAAVLVALTWRTRWRWPVLVMATVFAFAVGLGRLYAGVHYPTDVLAGWSAGVLWTAAVHRAVFPEPRDVAGLPR